MGKYTSDHIILKPHDWPVGPWYHIAARKRNDHFFFRGRLPGSFVGDPPPVIFPSVSGDNFAFVDIDPPTQDGRFALRDFDTPSTLRYVLYVVGAAGFESLQIQPGNANVNLTSFPSDKLGFQLRTDGLFAILNLTTFVHYHSLYANQGVLSISARLASAASLLSYNPGLNFRFDATSFYLKDEVTGLWVKPWIKLSGGNPELYLEPTV